MSGAILCGQEILYLLRFKEHTTKQQGTGTNALFDIGTCLRGGRRHQEPRGVTQHQSRVAMVTPGYWERVVLAVRLLELTRMVHKRGKVQISISGGGWYFVSVCVQHIIIHISIGR